MTDPNQPETTSFFRYHERFFVTLAILSLVFVAAVGVGDDTGSAENKQVFPRDLPLADIRGAAAPEPGARVYELPHQIALTQPVRTSVPFADLTQPGRLMRQLNPTQFGARKKQPRERLELTLGLEDDLERIPSLATNEVEPPAYDLPDPNVQQAIVDMANRVVTRLPKLVADLESLSVPSQPSDASLGTAEADPFALPPVDDAFSFDVNATPDSDTDSASVEFGSRGFGSTGIGGARAEPDTRASVSGDRELLRRVPPVEGDEPPLLLRDPADV